MALGANLVADDRTAVALLNGVLVASAPAPIVGMIEARGIGILAADTVLRAVLRLAIDMGQTETERLPPKRNIRILNRKLDLLHNVERRHFPVAILQYIRGGRIK